MIELIQLRLLWSGLELVLPADVLNWTSDSISLDPELVLPRFRIVIHPALTRLSRTSVLVLSRVRIEGAMQLVPLSLSREPGSGISSSSCRIEWVIQMGLIRWNRYLLPELVLSTLCFEEVIRLILLGLSRVFAARTSSSEIPYWISYATGSYATLFK